jgi:hypothetical protein
VVEGCRPTIDVDAYRSSSDAIRRRPVMAKAHDYGDTLQALDEWEPFLLNNSGLPGPRGNIELGRRWPTSALGSSSTRFLACGPDRAPVGSREEFLAFCGAVGLGRPAGRRGREGA